MFEQTDQDEAMTAAEETGTDPAIAAAASSVLLSWYYFFLRGDREMGLFVGLWPPTILAFASYFNQTRMSSMLKKASNRGGVRESVEKIVR